MDLLARLLPAVVAAGAAAAGSWYAARAASRRDLHATLARETADLRAELAALREQVGRQPAGVAVPPSIHPTVPEGPAPPATMAAAAPPQAGEEEVPAEVLAILAGAVAAYLGKRARIRSARRLVVAEANPWGVLGRVSVQTSHSSGAQWR